MNFLKKIFIKNYKDTSNPTVRARYGTTAGIIGIISNTLLFVCKIIIGILSASITIIVDAVNNLTDSASSVLTLVGFKLSNKPADREHPYGHARFEYIVGLMVSIITLIVGILFVKSCIEKIITPNDLKIDLVAYIVLGISLVVKCFLMLVFRNFGKSINSEALKANENDSRLDFISSSTILISMIVMGITKINIDGYIGLAVSLFIVYAGVRQISRTISPLISERPNKKLVNKIKRELLSFDGIHDMHDLLIHTYGSGSTFATVHVEVPADTQLLDIHELIDKIERHFEDKLNINLTIQIDPVDKHDPKTLEINNKINNIIQNINKKLTIHGLRVIYRENKVRVLFDITEDFDFHLKKSDVLKILKKEFSQESQEYEFVFTIDKPII